MASSSNISTEQTPGRLADEDGVGRRKRLKPCGEIGGFADDGALLRGASTDDLADHDETRGDADPRLKARPVWALDATHFCNNGESGTNGTFGRVLEGMREAEISQNAVAHELGDEAAEPPDRTSHRVLITSDQHAQKLRIDRARQRRGADHIAEQNRDLAALGGFFRLRLCRCE